MNILIIGGLLGLAVIAILGAVLLGIGEDRAEKARKANGAALLSQSSQTGQLPAFIEEQQLTLHKSGHLALPNEEERLTILHGQVHEITSELRTLAHKAGELELRLNNLSEVLEHQQYRPLDVSGQFYAPRTDTSSL
ncbi:MAG: hypothetical protein ABI234_20140 [Ktedonobacteraceae bacterium]